MRPIDGDSLIGALHCIEFYDGNDRELVYQVIQLQPTIESERQKGWWIIKETAYEDTEAKCSCCGFETLVDQPGNGLHMVSDLHYCPNCGSDMRGKKDDFE